MKPLPGTRGAGPSAPARRRARGASAIPRWAAPSLLILALGALALVAGLSLARPSLRLAAADPTAASFLPGFSGPEPAGAAAYRWSLPRAEIALGGLERAPVQLALRMAAPRPPEAPPAVTYLASDAWRLGDFVVGREWRRYRLLLPPAAGAIKLRAAPFVPGENDQRRLGVTLAELSAAPTGLTPPLSHSLSVLGPARAALLLLLPLAAFACLYETRRREDTRARRPADASGHPPPGPRMPRLPQDPRARVSSYLRALVPLSLVLLIGIAAAHPLEAAARIPGTWLLPGAIAVALALAVAAKPARTVSRRLRLGAALGERSAAWLIMAAALGQGLLFLFLMPPWQHYDEPSHFEYARMVADRGAPPAYGERDLLLDREITASMIEHGFYDPEIPMPPLLSDGDALQLSGGGTATGHQPPYYLLAGLPLRLARHLDVTSQLYLARAVSLLLYLAAAGAALGAARDLAPAGGRIRWLLPLGVVLCASYADLMTAVNNDGAAAACFSLFLWGAVRAIRRGLSWPRLAWVLGAALAAALFKNTGVVALALAPVACGLALWAQRGWRWRWLVAGTLAAAALALAATLAWDDAAAWYRWAWPSQAAATRVARPDAPLGSHVVRLEVQPDANIQQLSNPVLGHNLAELRGRRVTVGAWLWASRPDTVALGVLINTGGLDTPAVQPFAVGLTPRFVAWTYRVPEDAQRLQFVVAAAAPPAEPLEIYLDGAVLARGTFPAEPPAFADVGAGGGTWGGRSFANLLRNASAEEAGPRVRAWLDRAVARYARRSPSTALVSVLDIERTGRLTFLDVAPSMADMFFTRFGWGGNILPGDGWVVVFRGLALASLAGCALWLLRPRPGGPDRLRPALAFLGLAALLVWGNAVLRIHPLIDVAAGLTAPRYGFPAIIPTVLALVAGWCALWPARLRAYGVALLVAGMIALEALVVVRIWEFYYG